MRSIKKYVDHINEEIEGAKEYAENYIEWKARGNIQRANSYRDMAQDELNHAMMTGAENKTVIFISHRLSTTRNADKIFMMEKGKIIESGSHEELMNLNGKYAEMFNLQAEKYNS